MLGQITLNSLKVLFSQSNISKKQLFSTKYEFENLFFLSSTPSFSTWFSNCVQNQAKHKIKELETKFLDFLENCNKGCLEEPLRPTFNISGEKNWSELGQFNYPRMKVEQQWNENEQSWVADNYFESEKL